MSQPLAFHKIQEQVHLLPLLSLARRCLMLLGRDIRDSVVQQFTRAVTLVTEPHDRIFPHQVLLWSYF